MVTTGSTISLELCTATYNFLPGARDGAQKVTTWQWCLQRKKVALQVEISSYYQADW